MLRSLDIWGPAYLKARLRALFRRGDSGSPRHYLFCIADHFEPFRETDSPAAAERLTREWCQGYAAACAPFRDAGGRPPRHTFFYPADEYHPGCLDRLAEFCRSGWGETEIQLHHRGDTAGVLEKRLTEYRELLRARHGLLGVDGVGSLRYGFVHGNWALCNSRPDGDWCGVDGELAVLERTGCYADFTFPSAPSPTQPRTVNAIYRASDRPGRNRGHDRGIRTRAAATSRGKAPRGALLLVQGPLALDWKRRKWGILPRLENAEISGVNPPGARRLRLWTAQRIGVLGRPEWIFVKVHTHGCVPSNRETLLGAPMRTLHRLLATGFNDGSRRCLHYVTAREMYNIIRAAEHGHGGDPGKWRDFEIAPPPCK